MKGYSLAEIAPSVRRVAEAGAVVVPLLNGVEAADRLVEGGVPSGMVLGGLTQISVARVAPGVVERRSAFQRVVVGEIGGGRIGSCREDREGLSGRGRGRGRLARHRVGSVAEVRLHHADGCRVRPGPLSRRRRSSRPNSGACSSNGRCARFSPSRGRGGSPWRATMTSKILSFIGSLPGEMRPSFLLDLESGGPTEIEDLCGAVSRLGRQAGVETRSTTRPPRLSPLLRDRGSPRRDGRGPGPGRERRAQRGIRRAGRVTANRS